jgi:hypothetical protein
MVNVIEPSYYLDVCLCRRMMIGPFVGASVFFFLCFVDQAGSDNFEDI